MATHHQLSPTLEALEDAIVAALRADATIAAYARDIQSFQGDLEQALEQGSVRDPAFLVIFAGGQMEPEGVESFTAQMEFHVIVRARNLRGNDYQRKPQAASEVGTYQMVQDTLRVLAHNDFGLAGLRELEPQGMELLQAGSNKDRTLSAYTVVFMAQVELQAVEPDELLNSIATTYEIANPDEGDGSTGWAGGPSDLAPIEQE